MDVFAYQVKRNSRDFLDSLAASHCCDCMGILPGGGRLMSCASNRQHILQHLTVVGVKLGDKTLMLNDLRPHHIVVDSKHKQSVLTCIEDWGSTYRVTECASYKIWPKPDKHERCSYFAW